MTTQVLPQIVAGQDAMVLGILSVSLALTEFPIHVAGAGCNAIRVQSMSCRLLPSATRHLASNGQALLLYPGRLNLDIC
jgi:hypothetical protein